MSCYAEKRAAEKKLKEINNTIAYHTEALELLTKEKEFYEELYQEALIDCREEAKNDR